MGDTELRRIFAENLRNYLAVNGYTQADMARYMKVSTATAAKWYTGQTMPRVDKIQSLCNWFMIEKSDLLEPKDQKDHSQYYLNTETAKVAQEVFDDPDLRVLFDAARGSRPEDIRMAADMLKRFKETNPDG